MEPLTARLIVLTILIAAVCAGLLFRRPLAQGLDHVLETGDNVMDHLRRRGYGNAPLAALLILPAFAILLVFAFFPLLYAIYLSLHDMRWGRGPFIGLQNYGDALTAQDFWQSASVTVYYALVTVPLTLVIALIIANALHRITLFRGLFRTVYFLPFVTSTVAAATVWRIIFHPRHGAINLTLEWLGVPKSAWPEWLFEPRGILHIITGGLVPPDLGPSLALCCIMIFEIWRSSGFMILVLLAGLSAIPPEYEEAAKIDGARSWQIMRFITLPLLSPAIFFLLIVGAISAFQSFDAFYALTGDGLGPLNTTRTLTVYIYNEFFVHGREGYGAALASLLCAAIILLTVLQWRLLGRRVHYS